MSGLMTAGAAAWRRRASAPPPPPIDNPFVFPGTTSDAWTGPVMRVLELEAFTTPPDTWTQIDFT
jgi:hypothetical protein